MLRLAGDFFVLCFTSRILLISALAGLVGGGI